MTISVNTIANLKALTLDSISKLPKELTADTSPYVIVQGYHEPDDGGGGSFFWDSVLNVDLSMFPKGEDFGTIIKPNWVLDPSVAGRWRRLYDEPISVKWFGARGDFDPWSGTGGDLDTDAIQGALDVAKRTGIPLYLPPGKYKITSTLRYHSSNLDADGQVKMTVQYWNTQQGLYIFGAGMQKSILYNQIRNTKDPPGAAISIIREKGDTRTFQQSGIIRDLQINSDQMIDGSIGIDMKATWAYTIQRVRIMNMGSHGIKIQNRTGDADACENVHLDNVVSEYNGGWGIIVDAGEGSVSTGFIHMERCKIRENKLGGIQWTGQIGLIERCGIHGNGVYVKKDPRSPTPEKPTAVPDAYGILVKNVKGTSNGLLITGCEIQGNADVQVMVAVGANIKIVQNEFKDDDLAETWSFPSVDIQVGDGNMDKEIGGIKIPRTVNACVIEDNRIRTAWKTTSTSWGKEDKPPSHTVVKVNTNAVGTVIGKWWTSGYKRFKGDKLVELVEKEPLVFREGHIHLKTHLHIDGTEGGHVLLPFASKRFNINNQPTDADPNMSEFKYLIEARIISVTNDKSEVTFIPDTSQWSNFNIIIGGTFESTVLANPTVHTVAAPLFFEFVNVRSRHPLTLRFGSEYVAGEGIVLSPGEIVSGIMIFDETHHWRLYTPWTCRGVPLSGRPPQSTVL
jgi:hypothetical protein